MGGYGIVGGNLPIAAGHRARRRLRRHRRGHAVHVRRRRLQPGHVRRDAEPRRAVAAAGRLHGHQQPVRHGHRARAPLRRDRPAAQGRGLRRARHALRRHGRARHLRRRVRGASSASARSAGRCSSRRSPTASAATRWPTPRSTAPRSRSTEWRERDPIAAFGDAARRRGRARRRASASSSTTRRDRARRRGRRVRRRPRRSRRPSRSTTTSTCSATRSRGWYSVDERTAGVHRGEDERAIAENAHRPTRPTSAARGDAEPQADARRTATGD